VVFLPLSLNARPDTQPAWRCDMPGGTRASRLSLTEIREAGYWMIFNDPG
jgi:hypothetical protein